MCGADESNPVGDALRYQSEGTDSIWLGREKKQLEQLGVGNIWNKEHEWDRKVSKGCADIGGRK